MMSLISNNFCSASMPESPGNEAHGTIESICSIAGIINSFSSRNDLSPSSLSDTPSRGGTYPVRSEEHTSELQSRFDLVCRLLLEKKNTHQNPVYTNTTQNHATKLKTPH